MNVSLQQRLVGLNHKLNTLLRDKSLLQEVVFDQDIQKDWEEVEDSFPHSDLSVLDGLDEKEIEIAMLALCRYIAPSILFKFDNTRTVYPGIRLFGGTMNDKFFIPTVRSALFLIEPIQFSKHPAFIEKYFSKESPLFSKGILKSLDADPLLGDSELECSNDFVSRITRGKDYEYVFPSEFPAVKINSPHQWQDLILPHSVESKLSMLLSAFQHHKELTEHPGIGKHFKKSVVALFSGEPGTGKSMTAGMLGKQLGLQVYRIDISQLVSKWVGETAKNLRILFDVAEQKNWILFFDEADSIFSRRSKGDTAHDSAKNHDISYILMRIESFQGFVILATNLGINIDEAFRRRIDMEITFMQPDTDTRLRLWQKAFSDAGLTFKERQSYKLRRGDLPAGDWDSPDVGMNYEEIAEYWDKATGAKIMKVMRRLLEEAKVHQSTHIPSGVMVRVLNAELGLRKM
ncbi:MAG: ATP-binding protein [Cytophagaceae bacterium]|nr:ATP-binding protein [Cytophagaceae bacterium]